MSLRIRGVSQWGQWKELSLPVLLSGTTAPQEGQCFIPAATLPKQAGHIRVAVKEPQ